MAEPFFVRFKDTILPVPKENINYVSQVIAFVRKEFPETLEPIDISKFSLLAGDASIPLHESVSHLPPSSWEKPLILTVEKVANLSTCVALVHEKWLTNPLMQKCFINIVRDIPNDSPATPEELSLVQDILLTSQPEVIVAPPKSSLAWHTRSRSDENTIYLSETLEEKLLSCKAGKQQGLIVLVAMIYLHELAHWAGTRAHGIKHKSHDALFWPAAKEPEAGYYLESVAFGGRVRIQGESKWKVAGFVVENKERTATKVMSWKLVTQLAEGKIVPPLDTSDWPLLTDSCTLFRTVTYSCMHPLDPEAKAEPADEDEEGPHHIYGFTGRLRDID